MVTLTGNNGFTVIITVLLTAGLPVVQVALDVRVQVIVFPLVGTKVYAAFVAPFTLAPFTFHW